MNAAAVNLVKKDDIPNTDMAVSLIRTDPALCNDAIVGKALPVVAHLVGCHLALGHVFLRPA